MTVGHLSGDRRPFDRGRRALAAVSVVALTASCAGGAVSAPDDDGGSGSGITDRCASYDGTEGITDTSITVGFSGALSGPFAATGAHLWGMQAYFDMVNAAGGVETADGRKRTIELIYKDDHYVASTAKANVQEMIDDKGVFAMLSVIGTSANMAIRPVLDRACVPGLFAGPDLRSWGTRTFPGRSTAPLRRTPPKG